MHNKIPRSCGHACFLRSFLSINFPFLSTSSVCFLKLSRDILQSIAGADKVDLESSAEIYVTINSGGHEHIVVMHVRKCRSVVQDQNQGMGARRRERGEFQIQLDRNNIHPSTPLYATVQLVDGLFDGIQKTVDSEFSGSFSIRKNVEK